MTESVPKPLHVVAAAVIDAEGRILIAQRPPGKRQAGSWEFPGGKVEPGEGRVEALARELGEELGITLTGYPRPLMRIRHAYPFGDVLIDMWVVTRYRGSATELDGQALRWCTAAELDQVQLLPADRPIARGLRLPERLTALMADDYAIGADANQVGRGRVDGELGERDRLYGALCGTPEEAITAATRADFIVLTKKLSGPRLSELCSAILIPVFAHGLPLDLAWQLGASGVNELP